MDSSTKTYYDWICYQWIQCLTGGGIRLAGKKSHVSQTVYWPSSPAALIKAASPRPAWLLPSSRTNTRGLSPWTAAWPPSAVTHNTLLHSHTNALTFSYAMMSMAFSVAVLIIRPVSHSPCPLSFNSMAFFLHIISPHVHWCVKNTNKLNHRTASVREIHTYMNTFCRDNKATVCVPICSLLNPISNDSVHLGFRSPDRFVYLISLLKRSEGQLMLNKERS